jgi:hypothetical protein
LARRAWRNLLLAAAVLGSLPAAGCYRGPATAQVSGKVVYKDGSAPKAGVRTVRFEPAPDTTAEIRKGAAGQIEDDGSFVMFTRKPGDGVYHGKYDVTFAVWKGPMDPTPLIPDKYADATTTPYHVTIDGDRSDLVFEIERLGGGK